MPARVVSSVVTAIVCLIAAVSPALAQLQNWYGCTHPDFKASFGYSHIMVAGDIMRQFGAGDGVTCNLLDIDYESSHGRACYLAWQFPNNSWAVFAVQGGDLDPLVCP